VNRAAEPDPAAFAALLCDWCLEVRPGQQVLVGMPLQAMPLVRALHAALLERDAWPLMRVSPAEFAEDFYWYARELHLDGFPPLDLLDVQTADAFIGIEAPANTRALASTDPTLIARAARARKPIQEARLALRWCRTIWPTPALAQQAAMGEREYAEFVTRALFLDRPDAIEAWRELSARQQRLVQRLSSASEIRIEADGTDFRVRVDGRTWINSDGKRNMPSGEVFTGPLEDSAHGTIRFTVPSSPRGIELAGVELTFERGKVVHARAEKGEDYLRAALAIDSGAVFLGELGIGTNTGIDRPTGAILLDEKMAGTVHLALGRSYPETGGTNVSALHWDLICDLREGGRIGVDRQVLNENGQFVE
jgi:aminopeptidase